MTNATIYRKAQTLPFVQFCKWYDAAVRKRKSRNSNTSKTLPSSVVECSEVGSSKAIIKKSTGALLIYEDQD
jgi:hypothetical protein